MTAKFDAIVIGTGQSGPSLAERFAERGQRVAVIERKNFGGTCVNTGCIPTKTLVASAHVAHMARRAAEYGVDVGGDGQGRHEARQGAQGRRGRRLAHRRHALDGRACQRHRLSRPRALHGTAAR